MPGAFFGFSDITNGRCLMMGRQREAFNYKDNRCSKVASLASVRNLICCLLIKRVAALDASKRYGAASKS